MPINPYQIGARSFGTPYTVGGASFAGKDISQGSLEGTLNTDAGEKTVSGIPAASTTQVSSSGQTPMINSEQNPQGESNVTHDRIQ